MHFANLGLLAKFTMFIYFLSKASLSSYPILFICIIVIKLLFFSHFEFNFYFKTDNAFLIIFLYLTNGEQHLRVK
jgi:hypothetical protein